MLEEQPRQAEIFWPKCATLLCAYRHAWLVYWSAVVNHVLLYVGRRLYKG